ncbi:MAG TPA: hypothetical protein VHB49_13975 [Bradyrhizobium sp.]|nr:hypothetical protein [Bradyrhizobium sp.]
MPIGFGLLLVCIAAVPVLILFDGPVAQSLLETLAAVALAFVATSARATDVRLAAQTTSRLRLAAAVPILWMLFQLSPVPFSGMTHSIWVNANEALNQRSFGHISIDLGRTIEAIVFYLANIALIIVSVFAVRDRRRAELALFVLAAVATLATLVLLISRWLPAAELSPGEASGILAAVSSLGIILSLACGTRAIERAESRRSDPSKPQQNTGMAVLGAGIGLLLCLAGLAVSATFNIWLATAFGIAAYISVQIVRRLGLAGWAAAVLIATLTIAAAMIILWRYNVSGAASPLLQFATAASADAISVARRMLADTSWRGTGAGTYAQLLPVYQELGAPVMEPPSTAAAFAIELGWPMMLFVFTLGIGMTVVLYRGALVRGRDSFYPAAASACVVILLLQAFCDASLLHTGIAVLADAIIGLGLAQSVSRGDGS